MITIESLRAENEALQSDLDSIVQGLPVIASKLSAALALLWEWHNLHCESDRTLDAADTYSRTQRFLIENEWGVKYGDKKM